MSNKRWAANVDANQPGIVEELRKFCSVEVNHDDILVGYQGKTYWYEIKAEDAVSKKTGLILESKKKDSQKRLEKEWAGHYKIVSSLNEILTDMGVIQ